MPLQQWSTTPATNASAVTNVNMATGSAPSTVHPSIRQMMADVATWYASAEWLAQADVPTYSSATVFTVPGNRTSVYSVGRRVQATGTGYTINGTISVSAFTSLTTVTVVWDSGSLDATVTAVGVGILQSQLQHMTITGGTIDGAVIGGTTPGAGHFTTLSATGNVTFGAPASGNTLAITANAGSPGFNVTTASGQAAINIAGPAATQLTALQFQQTGQTQWSVYQPSSSGDLRFYAGADRIVFNSGGNVTINAPSSGIALTVTQQGTNNCINFGATGNATNGVGDIAFDTSGNMYFGNGTSNTSLNLGSFSAGTSTNLLTAGNNRLSVSSTGNVTINAPSSGTAFVVNDSLGAPVTVSANFNGAANAYFQNSFAGSTSVFNCLIQANNGTVQAIVTAAGSGFVNFGSNSNHTVSLISNGQARAQVTAAGVCQYNLDAAGTYWELGTRDIPQNIQSGNYTLALTDRGKEIYCNNAGAQAITIPANASVAFPVGAVVSITNMGTTAITIPITTDTLNWSPGGTTGTRTLAKFGTCVLKKVTSTTWLISGTGLT